MNDKVEASAKAIATFSSIRKVVTHDGIFHADDVFAVAALRMYAVAALRKLRKQCPSIEIVRTRDKEVISKALADSGTVLIDVGGVFDVDRLAFDHHQRDFKLTRGGAFDKIKYSSFGLVWNFLIRPAFDDNPIVQVAMDKIDTTLVVGIDAVDNGFDPIDNRVNDLKDSVKSLIPANDCNTLSKVDNVFSDSNKSHHVHPVDLSTMISSLNPTDLDYKGGAFFNPDDGFTFALDIADVVLMGTTRVQYSLIENEAYLKDLCTDPFSVLVSDKYVAQWQSVVVEYDHPLFFVYPDVSGQWRCQCVPVKGSEMVPRLPLPSEWGGLSGEDLIKVTGIPDAVFCHAGRFICGTKTRDSAIAMAYATLRLSPLAII